MIWKSVAFLSQLPPHASSSLYPLPHSLPFHIPPPFFFLQTLCWYSSTLFSLLSLSLSLCLLHHRLLHPPLTLRIFCSISLVEVYAAQGDIFYERRNRVFVRLHVSLGVFLCLWYTWDEMQVVPRLEKVFRKCLHYLAKMTKLGCVL